MLPSADDLRLLGPLAVLGIAATLFFVRLVMRMSVLKALIPTSPTERIATLDGLRGLVALCVVFHHSIMGVIFAVAGTSGAPIDNFQNQLGSAAVAIFFMISAYLFCGDLLRKDGRLPVLRFFENRAMRIVPLYLACVGGLTFFALARQDFALVVSPDKLLRETVRWLLFNFVPTYTINGVVVSGLLGQFWSLRYEWLLYLCLPVLAWGMRRTGSAVPLFAGLALLSAFDGFFAFFTAGAAAAALVGVDGPRARIVWLGAGAVGIAAVLFLLHDSTGWPAAILLLPFFVAVVQGSGPFALLAARPLRFLGEISYSLYLTHGFAAALFVGLAGELIATASPIGAFLLMLGRGVSGVLLAVVAYLLIERPTMRRRPVTAALAIRRGAPALVPSALHPTHNGQAAPTA